MSNKRDDLFPAGSIGRSQGNFIQRVPSPAPSLTREPLTAHPLLSPIPSSASVAAPPTSEAQDGAATAARYATYTPRHRTAPTTVTTLQSPLSVSPQQQPGGSMAANKLQLMNLKAGAQSVGLETGSVGWEILEKLVAEHEINPDWADIWNALPHLQATLLLPLENGGHTDITADFVRDHIALCDGPSGDPIPIVTLSGLRGVLVGETLTLRSSILPGSKSFEGLLVPSTRASTLASLPPLPHVPASPPSQPYPTFTLPAHTHTLPLPPHVIAKPPLPPRPGQRATSQTSTSRLSSSFASLFGKTSAPTTPAPTPPATNAEHEHAVEVPAYTIDRRIVRKDVSKAINKALKNEVKEALSESGAPSWAIERVHEFTNGLYPFVKSTSAKRIAAAPPPYIIDPPQETAEELSAQFQGFYAELEEDLLSGVSPVTAKPTRDNFLEVEQEKARERRLNGKAVGEQHAREILEAVERVICLLFYDRLYLQPKSDDASHDEALSSRVAALNMLDLGLEHLGVDVGAAGAGVEAVLRSCGDTLSRLERSETRCPADKAAVLVAAHKTVVDGLSRLPPIRLKSEAELENQKTPETSHVPTSYIEHPGDDKAAPLRPDPPPIIVSPVSETHIHVASPDEIHGPAPPTSDTSSVVSSHTGEGYLPSYDAPPDQRSLSSTSKSSRPSSPTPVSGDIILPLMIFSVVKANPQHLVSHLLYTQRFRNQRVGGEESYCLVSLMAVADFLENVDLKALGLGESEKKVMSTADLTPIPVRRAALESQAPPLSPEGVPARLRRGVEQQVDAIAGSANKVILGVVDQGFGVLRALLPGTSADAQGASADATTPDQEAAPWNAVRPGFGLLRRESGFSIASLAASFPGRERARSFASTVGTTAEESGQMLVEVSSRPASVRGGSAYGSDVEGSTGEESQEDDDEEDYDDGDDRHDTRSIRSFESMMGRATRKRRPRKSLTDRLASMPGLSRLSGPQPAQPVVGSPPASRRSSLLPLPRAPTPAANRVETPVSSRAPSPIALRISPPNQRFLDAAADDLRLSEVKELLREYKRVVEGLRAVGGFEE
ncbi:hypothetical protein BC834DRAFT_856516 [Gloeopeniophorella convolvens]|nr:hypothetical protein BC834DRAFT_856516 [Gloeopeniophorella convolvens]